MASHSPLPQRGPLGALMFGNFVVACGVMVMPGGLRVAPLSLASWLQVARSPRLWCAGQFMVLGDITPLLRHVLAAPPLVRAGLLTVVLALCIAADRPAPSPA